MGGEGRVEMNGRIVYRTENMPVRDSNHGAKLRALFGDAACAKIWEMDKDRLYAVTIDSGPSQRRGEMPWELEARRKSLREPPSILVQGTMETAVKEASAYLRNPYEWARRAGIMK
ncbi:MAG: hypothetical protein HYW25_00550 [Candidatus Aenigmarchaeota archaeon]|nr:hypothetical protein [Candidatus Aenigmarchaeota archaeon]